jgi:hypothetical protein
VEVLPAIKDKSPTMTRLRSLIATSLVVGLAGFAFRQGWVPPRLSPVPALNLEQGQGWLLDWQLAEIRRDVGLCQRMLKSPHIDAAPIADQPMHEGCGIHNGVRVSMAGGARLAVDRMSCEAAAAVAFWLAHDVQPAAELLLSARVASVQHMGSYNCRNIGGGNLILKHRRSEHATGNALDVAGFTLTDGRRITVQKHWKAEGVEGQFMRMIHARACRTFRVTLGPNANAAHHDHFHLDRGLLSTCR